MSATKGPNLLEEEKEEKLEEEEEKFYGTMDSMDPELYRATIGGDIIEFVKAMERIPQDTRQYYEPLATCVQLDPQKNTVLHLATRYKHYEIVKLLCKDLPFHVAERNRKGDTPLHIASRMGDLLLVNLLINADYRDGVLGEKNEEGNTALHEALSHRHENVARVLVDKNRGMSYSANKEGKSVLYLAAEGGYAGLVKLLMENPAGNCIVEGRIRNKSPVREAILGRNIDVLKVLWEKDQSSFDLRCDDEKGRNALHCAASVGYLEGVNFLLLKLCTALYQSDKHGVFPIHIAASKGYVSTVEEMLRHCPDSRELLNSQGQNVLHVAAKSGKTKSFICMLKIEELGSLINERDDEGNTPLHLATICGHPKIVGSLIRDERVKVDVQNNGRLTARDIAEENMQTVASFQKRLTWMALRIAGAPRSPHANAISRTIKSRLIKQNKTENPKNKINVILLVATLVATVTFSAGFTIPGGYNNSGQDQGIATMLGKLKFQEFVICDTIAMYTSIVVAVALIWAQLGDLNTMGVALKLALPLLGVSLTMMSIAFMAGMYLVVSKLTWLGNIVLFIGTNFVIVLSVLFVPFCFLSSSNYYMFWRISYYPFQLVLYALGSYNDLNDMEE